MDLFWPACQGAWPAGLLCASGLAGPGARLAGLLCHIFSLCAVWVRWPGCLASCSGIELLGLVGQGAWPVGVWRACTGSPGNMLGELVCDVFVWARPGGLLDDRLS